MNIGELMFFNKHRKWKNFLLQPSSQLRYGFSTFIILILALGYIQIHLMKVIVDTITNYAIKMNFDNITMLEVEKSLNWAWFLSIGSIMIVLLLSVGIGIFISHRFLGPAVRIKAMVKALNEGNYSAREQLRNQDEFQDIIAELNKLAAKLEKQSAASSKTNTTH